MEIIDIDKFSVAAYEFTDAGFTHKEQHEAASELLKNVLYDCYGICYDNRKILEGKHGKPYFEDRCVNYNITHAKGIAACIICGNSEVGIDAEPIRPGREKTIKKFMTKNEMALYESLAAGDKDEYMFRIWTLKEAIAKAYGTGIDENFSKPEFILGDNPMSTDNTFWYHQWKVSDGDRDYIISAALEK